MRCYDHLSCLVAPLWQQPSIAAVVMSRVNGSGVSMMPAGGDMHGNWQNVLCIRAQPKPILHSPRWSTTEWLTNVQTGNAALCNLFTDATITVGDQDFQVHRAVLAAASPYFECMFRSGMQEGKVCLGVHGILADKA